MCHANNEKRKTASDGQNWTTKSRKKSEEKKTYQYLEILEADTIKQTKMKEEKSKWILQENEKTTQN